jgi:uncharacterized damage-inducible protein DinB
MSEIPRIADLLRRAFEGEAFHGPGLNEILQDIRAEQAARRPIKQAHNIWEIVEHIAGWQAEVGNRLKGHATRVLPPEENFPALKDASEAAWKKTLQKLDESYRELSATMLQFPESRLGEIVPGRKYSFYALLHGIVQHDLYHAGQISLLKKAG